MTSIIYLEISLAVTVQGVEIRSWRWNKGTRPPSVSVNNIMIIYWLHDFIISFENDSKAVRGTYFLTGAKHISRMSVTSTHKGMNNFLASSRAKVFVGRSVQENRVEEISCGLKSMKRNPKVDNTSLETQNRKCSLFIRVPSKMKIHWG